MNCPYCGKEMQLGVISSGQTVAWYPGNGEILIGRDDKVRLCRMEFWDNPRVESFYCAECRMLVTPVPEIEEPFANVKSKLKGVWERAQQEKDAATADRAMQKEAKQKEKRRKKDPWEV